MAVYNGSQYVRDAIESILDQTLSDFEFIIFDDASDDDTPEIIKSYRDERIKLFTNEQNLGLTQNLRVGLEFASGAYVARMDADDIALPQRFATQMDYFCEHPQVDILGSSVIYLLEDGSKVVAHQPEMHTDIQTQLLFGFTLLHPTAMMKLASLKKHSLNYDIDYRVSQDHDLWTRAMNNLQLANVPTPLVVMREHGAKISRNQRQHQIRNADKIRSRVLDETGTLLSVDEKRIFSKAVEARELLKPTEVEVLERVLLQIVGANSESMIFHQSTLQKDAADFFREVCRTRLIDRDAVGLSYWKSELRYFDRPTLRKLFAFFLRSLGIWPKVVFNKLRRALTPVA